MDFPFFLKMGTFLPECNDILWKSVFMPQYSVDLLDFAL